MAEHPADMGGVNVVITGESPQKLCETILGEWEEMSSTASGALLRSVAKAYAFDFGWNFNPFIPPG